jgi:hypothetical protein
MRIFCAWKCKCRCWSCGVNAARTCGQTSVCRSTVHTALQRSRQALSTSLPRESQVSWKCHRKSHSEKIVYLQQLPSLKSAVIVSYASFSFSLTCFAIVLPLFLLLPVWNFSHGLKFLFWSKGLRVFHTPVSSSNPNLFSCSVRWYTITGPSRKTGMRSITAVISMSAYRICFGTSVPGITDQLAVPCLTVKTFFSGARHGAGLSTHI